MRPRTRGFTLVEVLVALIVVALGLAALLVAVSGTARTSGYLREKTVAEWIALNRVSEVRLNKTKFGPNTDTGVVYMANEMWHYDTRYFDTSIKTLKRISVRVYSGDSKAKGNPLAEAVGFLSSAVAPPGSSNNADWTSGTTPDNAGGGSSGGGVPSQTPQTPGTANPQSPLIPGTANPQVPTPPTESNP